MNKASPDSNSQCVNTHDDALDISIVIPVYNEENNIPELYRRLTDVMGLYAKKKEVSESSYEIVMVNDGSVDHSWQIIKDLNKKDPKVKGINFSKNFGKHPAIIAGLNQSKGNVLLTMDADLQAQPEDIPVVIEKLGEGYNIVWAVSKDREDNILIRFGAKIFYLLMNKLTSFKMPENTVIICMDKTAINAVKMFNEIKQMPDCIYSDIGFKREILLVEKKKRYSGKTNYSFIKRVKLFVTGIVSYSKIPLRIVTAMGLIMASFSFMWGLYILIKKILWNIPVSGYTSLFIAITMFSGVQLISLGVIAEYLGIVFDEVKKRPIYIISETT